MRVVRRAPAAVAEPRDEEDGDGGPHASLLLPRYPVSRLVGHEDGGPIQLVRFTGEFRVAASGRQIDQTAATTAPATTTSFPNDEEYFSRLDRRLLVCSSLDDTLKTFIFLHFELTGTKERCCGVRFVCRNAVSYSEYRKCHAHIDCLPFQ